MTTNIKNYIITYIDHVGEECIINSKFSECDLADKPLYTSLENAKKGVTSIRNYLKKDYVVSRNKYWYDDALKLNKEDEYSKKLIKCYLDNIHINENNTLMIREVDIKINTDLKFN